MNRDNLRVEDIDNLSDEDILNYSSEEELKIANMESKIERNFYISSHDSEDIEASIRIVSQLSEHLKNISNSKDEFVIMTGSPMENAIDVVHNSYELKINILKDMWKKDILDKENSLKI